MDARLERHSVYVLPTYTRPESISRLSLGPGNIFEDYGHIKIKVTIWLLFFVLLVYPMPIPFKSLWNIRLGVSFQSAGNNNLRASTHEKVKTSSTSRPVFGSPSPSNTHEATALVSSVPRVNTSIGKRLSYCLTRGRRSCCICILFIEIFPFQCGLHCIQWNCRIVHTGKTSAHSDVSNTHR